MKNINRKILLFYFFLLPHITFSQAGEWTWTSGSDTIGSLGVFGIQGVPSVNNHPPALYEFCDWKDLNGNLWVYGGWIPDYYGDLWKYNPYTNEWTWVKGTGQVSPPTIYGTLGVSDTANSPGERNICSATWTDAAGDLWLFGGSIQNDLWRYHIATNEWTWMNGSNSAWVTGNYGVQGVPSPSNVPGGRSETCSAWTDNSGNLWLFGGYGMDVNSNDGCLNDVWKYNIPTNEWTWMNGSGNIGAAGNYGTKRISSPLNQPHSRCTYTRWKDLQNNFWIMGGLYYDNISVWDYYNDVWKYDPSINEWTWMDGPNTVYDPGVYQNYCSNDSIQRPACRYEHRSNATDACGKFWLFGGQDLYNDLWVYDPLQLKWNWVSGTNNLGDPGNYGVKGVSSPTNLPPARAGAVAWWGNDNRFYLFGGMQYFDGFADLWVFTPDTSCTSTCAPTPIALFSASNNICPGTCTDFINLSANTTSSTWIFPGAVPGTSTDMNPANICYSNPGNYDVTLIASNANGSDTLLLSNYVTVFPAPAAQGILQSGDTLIANAGAALYQWFLNGSLINGATNYFYVATVSGNYSVVATDENGCEVEAVINNVVASNSQLAVGSWQLAIFPNPVEEKLYVNSYTPALKSGAAEGLYETAFDVSIYNAVGEKVYSSSKQLTKDDIEIDCKTLPSGLYLFELKSDNKIIRTKFMKQ